MVFGESVMGTLLCSSHSHPTTQLPPNNTTTSPTSHSHNTSQQHINGVNTPATPPNNTQTCRRVNRVRHNTSPTIHHPQYIATISPNNHQTCRRTDNYTVQHLPRTPLNVCCRENIPAHNTLCDDIVYTLCIHFPLLTRTIP